jgi:hypothetical protein
MDSAQALQVAIDVIRDGIDNDSLVADHDYALEAIEQLEKLLAAAKEAE